MPNSIRTVSLILMLLLSLLTYANSHASDRIALVIGNSQYHSISALKNPGNDAREIAKKLSSLGFDLLDTQGQVTPSPLYDLNETQFRLAIEHFTQKAQGKELAMIYYSGHGIQPGASSYLLPVDVPIASLSILKQNALSLNSILKNLDGRAQLTIAVFDACREIPEVRSLMEQDRTRNIDWGGNYRGLGPIQQTGISRIVAYSAASGELAADGIPGNTSTYTGVLLDRLTTPGQEIGNIFRDVATEYMDRYGIGQQPEVSITGVRSNTYYFLPRGEFDSQQDVLESQLKEWVKKGDMLADFYDYDGAINWYSKAANRSYAEAQFKLGEIYQGIGHCFEGDCIEFIEADTKKAASYLSKSAEQSYVLAYLSLARLYFGERDFVKEEYWALLAERAIQQVTDLTIMLNIMRYMNDNPLIFYSEKHKILMKSISTKYIAVAKQDSPSSMSSLTYAYYSLGDNEKYHSMRKKTEKGLLLLAEKGDSKAQFELGNMLESGEYKRYWYSRSANQGNPWAKLALVESCAGISTTNCEGYNKHPLYVAKEIAQEIKGDFDRYIDMY